MFLAVTCALMLHGPVALSAPGAASAPAAGPSAVAPWPAQAPDLVPPLRTAAVVVVCLAMLGTAGWMWRRAQLQGGGTGRERIDVLASRSFGPKHRVAVIETCGERILLALCDKDISVLSHLPCAAAGGDDGKAAAATLKDDAAPERRFEVLS